MESLPKSGGYYSHKGMEGNSTLMPIVLERDVQQAHTDMMVKCPYAPGRRAYMQIILWPSI